jgi:hypothetical protein
VFGRNTPFPEKAPGEEEFNPHYRVNPRYSFQIQTTPPSLPYQRNPLFTDWTDFQSRWLIQTHGNGGVSPSISLSYGEGPLTEAYGYHRKRQEWVINRLQRLYEGTGQTPREISEQDMKDLILSRIDSAAWFFQEMSYGTPSQNWFQTASAYLQSQPYGPQTTALMGEFYTWATTHNADLGHDSQTPLKWHIFWYYFKERESSPLMDLGSLGGQLYRDPYHYYWPHATTTLSVYYVGGTNKVGQALHEAAVLTINAFAAIESGYKLKDLLEVSIPFTDVKLETVGSSYSLRYLTFGGWGTGTRSGVTPKRATFFGGRLPLLIRFRKGTGPANDRRIWLMNNCIVSDLVNVLPEWQGSAGQDRYEGSFRKMAAGELYEWPLTETDSRLTWIDDFTNMPPIESSRKKG